MSIYEEFQSNLTVTDGVPMLDCACPKATSRLRHWLLYQYNKIERLNDDQQAKIKSLVTLFDNVPGLSLYVTTQKSFARWFLNYKEMKREFEKIGKGKPINEFKTGKSSLVKWVKNQKPAMRDKTLAPWQITLLLEAGLKPSVRAKKKHSQSNEKKWNENYEMLKEYKKETGHCCVPRSFNRKLSYWINSQRAAFHNKLLRPDRKKKLDELGFKWEKSHERKFE